MRLWKIQDPALFEKAKQLLEEISKGSAENKEAFTKEFPFGFVQYLSESGGWNLCQTYFGAKPLETVDNIPDGWKAYARQEDILVPNARTKEGKRILKALNPCQFTYWHVHDLLGLETSGRQFTLPGIYQSKDASEIFLKLDSQFYWFDDDDRLEEVTLSYANKQINP